MQNIDFLSVPSYRKFCCILLLNWYT